MHRCQHLAISLGLLVGLVFYPLAFVGFPLSDVQLASPLLLCSPLSDPQARCPLNIKIANTTRTDGHTERSVRVNVLLTSMLADE
jgi:hypothetical protein